VLYFLSFKNELTIFEGVLQIDFELLICCFPYITNPKMKLKFVLISLLIVNLACNKKQNNAQTNQVVVKDSLTDLDYIEGKVVQSTSGEWFIIKDHFIWKTRSEAATNDYLKSIEDGQNHILKNVPQTTLDQLSIAGEILPGLEYNTETYSTP